MVKKDILENLEELLNKIYNIEGRELKLIAIQTNNLIKNNTKLKSYVRFKNKEFEDYKKTEEYKTNINIIFKHIFNLCVLSGVYSNKTIVDDNIAEDYNFYHEAGILYKQIDKLSKGILLFDNFRINSSFELYYSAANYLFPRLNFTESDYNENKNFHDAIFILKPIMESSADFYLFKKYLSENLDQIDPFLQKVYKIILINIIKQMQAYLDALEKDEITIKYAGSTENDIYSFKIEGEYIDISRDERVFLFYVHNGVEIDKIKLRKYANSINSKARKIVYQDIICGKKHKEKYHFVENIKLNGFDNIPKEYDL